MKIKAKFVMLPTAEILKKRGLNKCGPVQYYIDASVIAKMKPYTPMRSGVLQRESNFVGVGSGLLEQKGPYARYQYYGEIMVDPVYKTAGFLTGDGWKSRRNVTKVLSGRPLKYAGAPMRGKRWFERMKADHKESILKGAQEIADRSNKH